MFKKIVYNLLHYLARLILFLLQWETKDQIPKLGSSVIICAPHTSYWDSFLTFLFILVIKTPCHFLIWYTYYNKLKWFCDLIGGIPVYEGRNGLVDTLNVKYSSKPSMKLFLSPEGDCGAVEWKMSFYYIALKQKARIGLGYIDYASKAIGCDTFIEPTGDIVADCAKIAAFYDTMQPKYPEKFNNLKLQEHQVTSFQNRKQEFN